jgi:uncharacterized membrane protein (UPF0182 family)
MAKQPAPIEWRWSMPPSPAPSWRSALRRRWPFYAGGALLLLAALLDLPGYVQKYLWMKQLGYSQIFWTLLSIKLAMSFVSFVFAFLFVWINVRHAVLRSLRRPASALEEQFGGPWRPTAPSRPDPQISDAWLQPIILAGSAIIALIFALAFAANWNSYLRFRYGGAYGLHDPLLGVDVGFYLFHLPFYELLQRTLIALAFVTLAAVGAIYAAAGAIQSAGGHRLAVGEGVSRHLSVLLFIVAVLLGFGFYLDRYDLVYSTLGVVYGAGYAADHVTRVALLFMQGVTVAVCGLLILNFLRPRMTAVVLGAVIYAGLYVIGVLLLPVAIQHFMVQPNELVLETPYLKNYIAFTRRAYGLDAMTTTSYPALPDLTGAVIARNRDTIQNIRLWDARPLLQTYRQSQAIRLYYDFYGVETDRYHLADGYHQVMLSTRELSPELPAKARTWVNERLQFTHGYGVVMNFVSTTAAGGAPQYLLQNIPPQSDYGMTIAQPSIYFGKSMRGYRIVDTGVKEFDYPKGNDNVYSSYAGAGGIPLDSFWKKLLFAWTQSDINILLTSYIQPQSRIQIWRRVHERIAHIAPFLRLDGDSYPVLSDGRLYWIEDAYTVSDYFPYSSPVQAVRQSEANDLLGSSHAAGPSGRTGAMVGAGFTAPLNYIRNSVKIVVDMYSGSVRFYVVDPNDPILAAYQRALPGVFLALDQLPADLRNHLRYPQDIFAIQAEQYRLFHMTDPQVFYNQEDLWQFPMENYQGGSHFMRPYYVLVKLPGSGRLQYLLMTPFTPQNRSNMISWMAAECDAPDYGHMLVFNLPKDKLIYGPNQVDALINQNTGISRQLTLWDQRGSRVVRGKQIVTPIENSFLYVVPLYLTATDMPFPQLKRVIAVADGRVAMAPTLDTALGDLFAPQQANKATPQAATTASNESASQSALERARATLDQALKALQQGNWDAFGKAMDALQHQLSVKTN